MTDRADIDGQVLQSAAAALGAVRLAELLAIFEARIEWLSDALVATQNDRAALLARVHQCRGSAASLGFIGLDRALAEIEQWLAPGAAQAAPMMRQSDATQRETADSSRLSDALRAAWQSSLAVAVLHSADLRIHRPSGSKR